MDENIDINKFAKKTFKKDFNKQNFIELDITKLPIKKQKFEIFKRLIFNKKSPLNNFDNNDYNLRNNFFLKVSNSIFILVSTTFGLKILNKRINIKEITHKQKFLFNFTLINILAIYFYINLKRDYFKISNNLYKKYLINIYNK